jgi:hypothetical protein
MNPNLYLTQSELITASGPERTLGQHTARVSLAELIGERKVNIRNKLSRGKFSAAFLLQSRAAGKDFELRF